MNPMRPLLALLLTVAAATAATLKVGDPAPTKLPTAFIKGTKVSAFDPKKAYLVEFWATWCGPCKESIPHLTELQANLKDSGLTVIGVHVPKGVTEADAFVKQMGKKMDYTVAKDTTGAVEKAWLVAAEQNGIPCSFVVVGGKVAFIGHPGNLTEAKVKELIAAGATSSTPDPKADPKAPAKK
jgi:thiol-disulfide isomerase/thioredoxin